jgi:hypothetical protein
MKNEERELLVVFYSRRRRRGTEKSNYEVRCTVQYCAWPGSVDRKCLGREVRR